MKKLLSAFLAFTLILSPVGNVVFQDQTTVEAKGYKSGKKSFNSNTGTTNKFQQDKKTNTTTTNKSTATTTPKGGLMSGGLMKGLMLGGLAGFLFGGLLANMGILGSFLGLMVNILAIFILFSVIRKIFTLIKNKRNKEANQWRS
ncbi:hypothetical protein ACLM5H_12605 [Fredinandcohnia humi]